MFGIKFRENASKQTESDKKTLQYKKYWVELNKANHRFIQKRPGLLFSLLFFLAIACSYLFIFKFNQHLTDKAFVLHTIESKAPKEQIEYIRKFQQKEPFDITRSLLTKTIHVKPSDVFKSNYYLQLNQRGIVEGDSLFFLKDKKWKRLKIPINRPLILTNNWGELLINYDIYANELFVGDSSLAILNRNSSRFEVRSFSRKNVDLLAESNNEDGEKKEIYYLSSSLGCLSNDSTSIMYTRLSNEASVSNEDGTYESKIPDKQDQDWKDRILSVSLPKSIINLSAADDGLLIHSVIKGRHYLSKVYSGMSILHIKSLTEIDTLVNEHFLQKEVTWNYKNGFFIFYNRQENLLTIINKDKEGQDKYYSRFFKIKSSSRFATAPIFYSYDGKTIWLTGAIDNKYGIAKVDLTKSIDTLQIHLLDYNIRTNHRPEFNVNNNGLVIYNNLATYNPDEDRKIDLQFLFIDKMKEKIDTLHLTKIIDSKLERNLYNYNIKMPEISPEFELVVKSSTGPNGIYEIKTSKNTNETQVFSIRNANNDSPSIIWPSTNFFSVESYPDYFMSIILIIGVILFYFFGLFYLLDFKNRVNPLNESELSTFASLATLYEKLKSTKNTMNSLKLRSEIMLWLGIVIGVAGMLAFVLSLNIFFKDTTNFSFNAEFTVKMLRTFAIFSFMEVFSFYFLKQYRIIFNEHKRYYSLYLRIMNYYQYIEAIEKFPGSNSKVEFEKMREAMLKDIVIMHEDSTLEKINEFEKSTAADIVKTLADKIPKQT